MLGLELGERRVIVKLLQGGWVSPFGRQLTVQPLERFPFPFPSLRERERERERGPIALWRSKYKVCCYTIKFPHFLPCVCTRLPQSFPSLFPEQIFPRRFFPSRLSPSSDLAASGIPLIIIILKHISFLRLGVP